MAVGWGQQGLHPQISLPTSSATCKEVATLQAGMLPSKDRAPHSLCVTSTQGAISSTLSPPSAAAAPYPPPQLVLPARTH